MFLRRKLQESYMRMLLRWEDQIERKTEFIIKWLVSRILQNSGEMILGLGLEI